MRSEFPFRGRDLLLMNDYDADPLWHVGTEVMVGLDQLPLSAELTERVRGWAKRWDELATQNLDANYGDSPELAHLAVPQSAWDEHEQDGRVLWRELQRELGDVWRVGWVSFPDGRRHVQWEPEGPVELCLPRRA